MNTEKKRNNRYIKNKAEAFPSSYIPSLEEAEKYLTVWDGLPNYTAHEEALRQLFRGEQSPFKRNDDLSSVIIKASALNDFYSTNIYRIFEVSQKIVSIKDFDERLAAGDHTLVADFQTITFMDKIKSEVRSITNYSFATKYCSHHQPEKFPIYDSYVEKVLVALREMYPMVLKFKTSKLREYPCFTEQLDIIRDYFGLEMLSYKELDRYLWQLGKRYFAKYPDAVNGRIDYDDFEVIKDNTTNKKLSMARFKISDTTTVGTLKKQFSKEIGGTLRIYDGRSEAKDDDKLVSIGAKVGEFECRSSRTVGSFEKAIDETFNLKVKVYTTDNWVKVLDNITLQAASELPNGMTKAKMEEYVSNYAK